MRRLLTIPREPIARLRALALWFALLITTGSTIAVIWTPALPPAWRLASLLCGIALGTWCVWGYRHARFPSLSWVVDAMAVFILAASSPAAFRGLALFYALVQFRALYVQRRELIGLVAAYAVARVASLAFAPIPNAYGAAPATMALQVGFLAAVAVTLHLVVAAAERQAAVERALHRSEERYRHLARATGDVVYEWDVATGVVEWSESLTHVFGFAQPPAGSNASWWIDRVHPDDRPMFDATAARWTTQLEDIPAFRYRVCRADGRYATVAATGVIDRAPDGTPIRVIGSVRDVTLMQQLEERLREAQKMEAVGELAAGIAHDFNNLLMVIVGHTFMVNAKGPQSPVLDEHMAGIRRAIDRASGVIRQLLAFGRRQRLEPSVMNLNTLVDDVVRMISPSVPENIEVVTQLDPLVAPVLADAGQVGQVLVNLALNARDAMPDGGHLLIASDNATLKAHTDLAQRTNLPPGEYVRLIVRDTGSGMDSATLARIFEPFFTTKAAGKGTGLGLATAYGIVKQSSGDIWADSAPGRGATFTLLFPVAARDTTAMVASGLRSTLRRPNELVRVLLVEDDADVRQFVRDALEGMRFIVTTATDGADALAVAEARAHAIDIVVTDIVMPHMNGPQMMERLRKRVSTLPVVYMTGYADAVELDAATSGVQSMLLEKPFAIEDLIDAIERMLLASDQTLTTRA